jgi:hypothetical protein
MTVGRENCASAVFLRKAALGYSNSRYINYEFALTFRRDVENPPASLQNPADFWRGNHFFLVKMRQSSFT